MSKNIDNRNIPDFQLSIFSKKDVVERPRFKSLKYDNKFTRENINYNFTISRNYSLLQNIATNISFENDLRIYHNDVLSYDKSYIDTNHLIESMH